jgi:F420-non-reducing hydrogenase iron-sulfur subunit
MNRRALTTYVFYCANNLAADQIARLDQATETAVVKTVGLPCSGKIDIPYLIKAFETGAEGAVIVTCKQHECHHFEGNLRAHKRVEGVDSLLNEIGLGAGRMAVIECKSADGAQAIDEIKRFMEKIRNLPNPGARSDATNLQETTVA